MGPLQRSEAAQRKDRTRRTAAGGLPVQSLADLLAGRVLALRLIRENLQIAISPGGRKRRKQIRFCKRGTHVTATASPF